jgi:hypothetical protein
MNIFKSKRPLGAQCSCGATKTWSAHVAHLAAYHEGPIQHYTVSVVDRETGQWEDAK